MIKPLIAPSLLAADLSSLLEESRRILALGADWLHIDIMDGHFVPNLTIGPPVVQCLRNGLPDAFLDCHCMVSDIHPWIEPLAKAKANQITFHIEIAHEYNSLCDILTIIKRKSIRTGVALKPMTPICNTLLSLIREDMIDMVLIMTVGKEYSEPGFGGQAFMKDTLGKVTQLRNSFPNLDIQVDGGLDLETVKFAAEAGANVIVSGTGIFKHSEPASAIEQMRDVVLRKICN